MKIFEAKKPRTCSVCGETIKKGSKKVVLTISNALDFFTKLFRSLEEEEKGINQEYSSRNSFCKKKSWKNQNSRRF